MTTEHRALMAVKRGDPTLLHDRCELPFLYFFIICWGQVTSLHHFLFSLLGLGTRLMDKSRGDLCFLVSLVDLLLCTECSLLLWCIIYSVVGLLYCFDRSAAITALLHRAICLLQPCVNSV